MSSPGGADRRVVIFTDDPGWHGRVLVKALGARGYQAQYASLTDCALELAGPQPRIQIPGFDTLPAGAFVRGVPGGTLEAVILRLNVLHALDLLGVPVYNKGRAIERSVDKSLTSFLLLKAGIPSPPTWVMESQAAAREVVRNALTSGAELVLKPLFGSQGEGLQRVQTLADFESATPVNGVYYLQRFIAPAALPYRDYRVLVVNGRACFAMSRTSTHWVTNRAQGGVCASVVLSPEMQTLSEAAARALEIDYAGVDLLQDAEGRWWVGEVNGVPAWWGLQQACGPAVTDSIVDGFCAVLDGQQA